MTEITMPSLAAFPLQVLLIYVKAFSIISTHIPDDMKVGNLYSKLVIKVSIYLFKTSHLLKRVAVTARSSGIQVSSMQLTAL